MLKIVKIRNIPIYKPYKGLPIGNMTSQILAVFYLNDIDHFIKKNCIVNTIFVIWMI